MNFIQLAGAERWSCWGAFNSDLCDLHIWRPSYFLAGLCERWSIPSTCAYKWTNWRIE